MAQVFRWLMRLFTGATVLAALAAFIVYLFATRSLPDYDRSYTVRGITGTTEIVRDNANVPHIFGPTDEDVFFGLGFAHAQDRLWQMTMLRRAAMGTLSELFGPRTLKDDELMRRFGFYKAARASVAVQDPETMAALKAYAAGVNAWIDTVNREALGRGAPEFWLFSPEIAPWQPADTIAVTKIMALQLSSHLQREVRRAQSALALPEERLKDLMPDVPGAGVVDLPDYTSLFPPGHRLAQTQDGPAWDPLDPVKPFELAGASNAWAAAPKRSAAGGTLLANDPHLGLTAPTIWYLARLELSTGGVIGGTIPGMPVVMVGRSDQLGWGLTSSYLDDQDIFMEELNPGNAQEYRTPTGWKPFETERTIIKVRDEPPRDDHLASHRKRPSAARQPLWARLCDTTRPCRWRLAGRP